MWQQHTDPLTDNDSPVKLITWIKRKIYELNFIITQSEIEMSRLNGELIKLINQKFIYLILNFDFEFKRKKC